MNQAETEMNQADLSPDDATHLARAQKMARRGWGHVHPNPMVGCVLVRDGEVVGEGYHQAFGSPHAEIVALEKALSRSDGATAYVSLEPCNHHGKTPPCTQALIEAGVVRVVYGVADPGGDSGGGGEALAAAGIEVVGPVWSTEVGRAENPAFFHTALHASPFVALKLAMSLDAKISTAPGARTRLTGVEAEREVHRLRSGFDAVMVGAGTLRADDPRLTPRRVPPGREPTRRIVLSSDASIPADAALLKDARAVPVHVFVGEDASESAMELIESSGAFVHPLPMVGTGLDLGALLDVCWEMGIRSIMCEGGAELAASLLREMRVHRMYLFIAPITVGEQGTSAFPSDAGELIWDEFRPGVLPEAYGSDTLIVLDRQEA